MARIMVTDEESVNMEPLSIEQISTNGGEDHGVTSAHIVGRDSWQQVALLMVTSFNCGYILCYSNLMLVPLGWAWGIICMLFFGYYTAYCNWVLAEFHYIEGKRFIRFRELMGHVYGPHMNYITWFFQFSMLAIGNMGFILLGARGLKEINILCSDSPLRLQYFIIITGFAYFLFAYLIPNMSSMRLWLGISSLVTLIYAITLVIIPIKDGIKNPRRNYDIVGSKADKGFNAFGAIAAIAYCSAPGLLPEIQSTLREPPVRNMKKAIYAQFTIGLLIYYGVPAVGYWAYGNAVSWYLPQNLSGPKWAKILTNLTVFIQSIFSQNMFATAIHETLDTKFLRLNEGPYSKENLKRRFIIRAVFYTVNSFVTAAFPFMGDLVNLVGSYAVIPITFMWPSMIFVKLKGKTASLGTKMWHWFTIILFGLLTIATTISAVRLFVKNLQQYKFFADL